MLEFILNILGKDTANIPEGATVDFTLRHGPKSWMVFVVLGATAALLYGVWWLYRHENQKCSLRVRSLLALFRSLIVLLAIFIFLGPAITYSTREIIKPYITVLLDNSLSMTIADQYADQSQIQSIVAATDFYASDFEKSPPSRADILNQLISHNDNQLVRQLRKRGNVRVLSFSDNVKLRATVGAQSPEDIQNEMSDKSAQIPIGKPIPPITPEGKTTNMGKAIRQARQLSEGKPMAGIVLFGDGQNNAGRDPRTAASSAGDNNIPIFTTGIGDPSDPTNIRVVDLWAPENVFQGNPVTLKASIQSNGIGEYVTELVLRRRRAKVTGTGDNTVQVVKRKEVTITEGLQSISLEQTPEQTGKFIYSVAIQPHEKELLTNDNSASAALSILDEQVRVLMIAGTPNWSYRLTKNHLLREKTVDLSCWLQTMSTDMRQEGDTVIDKLPRSRKQLLEYDVIMLFDPDPMAFDDKWVEQLKHFMDNHGGGVLWMAGPLNTFDFFTAATTSNIRELLSVRFGDMQSNVLSTFGNTFNREWPLQVPAEVADHPILQISENTGDVQKLWEDLPGIYWSFPATRVKPGGKVLLEHSNPGASLSEQQRPLLVAGHYGSGRSLYIGFQGTWRWRKAGQGYFQRFWTQAIRFLAQGRLMKGRNRGRVLTNRKSYAVGDTIMIQAQLYNPSFEPLDSKEVSAELETPDGSTQKVILRAVPGEEGRYETSVRARHVGMNQLNIRLNNPTGASAVINQQFHVKIPNAELSDPRMDSSLLHDIAQRSGGQYVALENVPNIWEHLPDRQEATIVHGRPIPLWDTSRVLILFVVLFSLEWALRKRFGLM